MPKIKTSIIKKSKRMVSSKKFKFSRVQVIALLLILSIVGTAVVYKSLADSVIWRFIWNSPGILHDIGVRSDNSPPWYTDVRGVIKDGVRHDVVVWEWAEVAGYSKNVQFGPYKNFTVVNGDNTLHVCYVYGTYNNHVPTLNNYGGFYDTVFTDVVYIDATTTPWTRRRLVSKTENVKWEPTVQTLDRFGYSAGHYVKVRPHCMDVNLRAGYYPGMEFRLRVTNSSKPIFYNDFGVAQHYDGGLVLYYTSVQFR